MRNYDQPPDERPNCDPPSVSERDEDGLIPRDDPIYAGMSEKTIDAYQSLARSWNRYERSKKWRYSVQGRRKRSALVKRPSLSSLIATSASARDMKTAFSVNILDNPPTSTISLSPSFMTKRTSAAQGWTPIPALEIWSAIQTASPSL